MTPFRDPGSDPGSDPGAGCRAFVRQFGDHMAAAARGIMPAHACSCPSCMMRLQFGLEMAHAIRAPIVVPEPMRQPAFLAGIYERCIEDAETGDFGRAMRPHLSKVPLPSSLPWPEQAASPDAVVQLLAGSTKPAPTWLWRRVRHEVLQGRRFVGGVGQRIRRLRVLAAAAAVLAVSVLAWNLASRQGTPRLPEIVFVTMTEMPLVQYPTAALRQGLLR